MAREGKRPRPRARANHQPGDVCFTLLVLGFWLFQGYAKIIKNDFPELVFTRTFLDSHNNNIYTKAPIERCPLL